MSAARVTAPRRNDGPDFLRDVPSVEERRTVGMALKLALFDFYRQSWRLLVLNTALSVLVLVIVLVGLAAPVALVLLLLVGPLGAALMHCAVVLAQTDELTLGEALTGLRLHWLRGLVLTTILGAATAIGIVAVVFYGRTGPWAWPVAGLVAYILALAGVFQLSLWPFAIHERGRTLRYVVRQAALELLRRPVAYGGLALALLLVNVLATAAALVPFLTLTIAYSFLAAAHFALPRSPLREDPR